MPDLIIPVPQPVQTDPDQLRWGIVSTVKGSLHQIARFIAYHLDLGAQRIHIHLDVPDAALAERLAHPKVRFTQCDEAYWAGKPNRARETHQMRQVFNATRVYRICKLDWLAHIDVDEFLLPTAPLPELLAQADPNAPFVAIVPSEMIDSAGEPHHFKRPCHGTVKRNIYPTYGEHVPGGFISTQSPKLIARTGLPDIRQGIHALRLHGRIVRGGTRIDGLELGHAHAPIGEVLDGVGDDVTSARVRPMELLGGSDTAYKAFIPPTGGRRDLVAQIYPTFGMHLRGGFLSHLAGKLFVRTGLPDISVQIHNAFQGGDMLPGAAELVQIDLAHAHAKSWEDWRRAYAYRLDKGSYRSEIKAATKPEDGGMSLHQLFHWLEAEQGEDGLRAFYDEVIADSPDMRARLNAHGLLRHVDLNLDAMLSRHFPDAAV